VGFGSVGCELWNVQIENQEFLFLFVAMSPIFRHIVYERPKLFSNSLASILI
jgi:DNA anti-recombination protein RmuC